MADRAMQAFHDACYWMFRAGIGVEGCKREVEDQAEEYRLDFGTEPPADRA